jgi:succinoglycan biosynthesis transport protein ExoP
MSTPVSTASSTTEGQSIPTGRFKPLVSLLKRKWLALFIFIVIISIGVPVPLLLETEPSYTVTSVILVSPKFIPNLASERGMDLNRTDYILYIKQQIKMIKRDDVLQQTLQSPEIGKYWLLPEETIGSGYVRLKLAIAVKNKRGEPFITVKLTAPRYEGLDIVLNGLVNTYFKKNQAENIYDSGGRIKRLQQRRVELEHSISLKQKHRTEIAEKLGVTTFQEDGLGPYDSIIIETTSALTQARRLRVEAEIRLATLTDKRPGKTILEILVNEMVANDSAQNSFKSQLINRRTELLTQTIGLTSKHPSRQRAEREIAQIDKDIEKATQALFKEIRDRLLEKHNVDVFSAQRIEQTLIHELEGHREQANQYVSLYHKALQLNKDISRAYQQLDKIDSRIDFLTSESTAPGFVRLDTPAKPLRGIAKEVNLIIILLIVIAALALGIGIPILIDILDKRIHTPGEAHKILGFPPIAWILDRHDMKTEQLATDSLRRMALTLERDWHTHKTSCFVLTSVKPGGGTTTLILELAHILSELGVRTLALELNAFKPDDRYKGTSPYNSLITLLNQEIPLASPEALVIPATEDLPERLPVGDTSKRYLATYGRLRPLIEQLNTSYDLIILDTPPLLLSADAELLGKVAGGVLLVIEAGVVSPGEIKRAAQLLERLNPPVVGSVLNRVKVFRGGGYFSELLKEYEQGTKLRQGWIKRLLLLGN